MKIKATKRLTVVCLIAVLLAAVLAYPIIGVSGGVALGGEYGSRQFEDVWYYGDGALDIAAAKAVVGTWDMSRCTKKIIAVVDTGIDASHEIFDGVLYENNDGNRVGFNSRTNTIEPVTNLGDYSSNKHGTSVAGVIAMLIKEFGLQDYIKIYPIKANSLSTDGTQAESINVVAATNAVRFATDFGMDAVNLSVGRLQSDNGEIWSENSTEVNGRAFTNAIYVGAETLFIVAAAGNDGKDSIVADNIFYPAGQSAIYGVMSYGDKSDGSYVKGAITPISNYGTAYDVAAPGLDIYTSRNGIGSTYHTQTGTSFASSIATFAGMLLKLRYEAEGKTPLSGAHVTSYMRNLALDKVDRGSYRIKRLDLKTVVTQNFEETVFNYDAANGIQLAHDGTYGTGEYVSTIVMHASNLKKIEFSAKISPYGKVDPDLYLGVEWYLRTEKNGEVSDVRIGDGGSLSYTPTVFGKTKVVAKLHGAGNYEATQDIYVEYAPYLVGDVRVTYAANMLDDVDDAPSGGVLYTTETTVFGLTGIQLVDKDVTIKWFVDGELVGEGETFAYTPKTAGKHLISAQYGDNPRINTKYVFVADVKPFIARSLDLSMLIIGLAVVVAAVIVGIIVAVKKKRNKVTAVEG